MTGDQDMLEMITADIRSTRTGSGARPDKLIAACVSLPRSVSLHEDSARASPVTRREQEKRCRAAACNNTTELELSGLCLIELFSADEDAVKLRGAVVVCNCGGENHREGKPAASNQWHMVKCCRVSWCLLTAVQSRCTPQKPVSTVQHRETECIPFAHKRAARDPLDASCGVSCRATCWHHSPIHLTLLLTVFLVRKKESNKYRLVVSHFLVNKNIHKDHFPLPMIDYVLQHLGKARVFPILYLNNSLYQCLLDLLCLKYTSFSTQYEFTHIPIVSNLASHALSRILNFVLSEFKYEFVFNYIDDIIVYSGDYDSHLLQVFGNMREFGFTVNPDKVTLGSKKTPRPKTLKGDQKCLGTLGYYSRFIELFFRSICILLNYFKKKGVEFVWGPVQESAFIFSKHFVVQVDASSLALGAVLSQQMDLVLAPVAFGSHMSLENNSVGFFVSPTLSLKSIMSKVPKINRKGSVRKHYLLGDWERIAQGLYLETIPALAWSNLGKPWKTEIKMAGPEFEPGSSRMRAVTSLVGYVAGIAVVQGPSRGSPVSSPVFIPLLFYPYLLSRLKHSLFVLVGNNSCGWARFFYHFVEVAVRVLQQQVWMVELLKFIHAVDSVVYADIFTQVRRRHSVRRCTSVMWTVSGFDRSTVVEEREDEKPGQFLVQRPRTLCVRSRGRRSCMVKPPVMRGDERVDAHVSVATIAPTLLALRRAKLLQPGGCLKVRHLNVLGVFSYCRDASDELGAGSRQEVCDSGFDPCFIQHQYLVVPENGPGEANKLPLADTEVVAAFVHMEVQRRNCFFQLDLQKSRTINNSIIIKSRVRGNPAKEKGSEVSVRGLKLEELRPPYGERKVKPPESHPVYSPWMHCDLHQRYFAWVSFQSSSCQFLITIDISIIVLIVTIDLSFFIDAFVIINVIVIIEAIVINIIFTIILIICWKPSEPRTYSTYLFESCPQLLVGELVEGVQVLPQRRGEEDRLLRNNGDALSQVVKADRLGVHAVYQDGSFNVREAVQRRYQRRLPGPSAANYPHLLAVLSVICRHHRFVIIAEAQSGVGTIPCEGPCPPRRFSSVVKRSGEATPVPSITHHTQQKITLSTEVTWLTSSVDILIPYCTIPVSMRACDRASPTPAPNVPGKHTQPLTHSLQTRHRLDARKYNKVLRKGTAAETPSSIQLSGTLMSKQRVDIGHDEAERGVFPRPNSLQGRSRIKGDIGVNAWATHAVCEVHQSSARWLCRTCTSTIGAYINDRRKTHGIFERKGTESRKPLSFLRKVASGDSVFSNQAEASSLQTLSFVLITRVHKPEDGEVGKGTGVVLFTTAAVKERSNELAAIQLVVSMRVTEQSLGNMKEKETLNHHYTGKNRGSPTGKRRQS
ncbi:hypothetical protein PR048_027526 [Dryococelus australis]|uniref:Reverse transcriptase domain-containing protein n=1 Tax=Dryococelus australis TaxID=614101 RepID=A0ABQ9GGT5_9NEOP|nr:hypothetical protein PR048_027526 [Dryococelus australis]